MNTFRVLFSGSRSWDRPDIIHGALDIIAAAALESGYDRVVLVHGACPTGGDAHADSWYRAKRGEMPLGVERYPANWKVHGKKAGFLRDRYMVDIGAHLCLAAIRDNSRGASMTAELAERAEIPVQVLDYDAVQRCPECRCDPVLCETDDTGDHCEEQSCGSCLHGCPLDPACVACTRRYDVVTSEGAS